jgi:hypothetical protein
MVTNYRKEPNNMDCCKTKAQALLQKIHSEEFAIDRHPNHVCKGFDEGQNNIIQLNKRWIKEIFNVKASNFDLYSTSKQISVENYSRLSQIPEDITDLNDCIDFLIKHYYEHQELTSAQKILSSEEGIQ